MRSTYFFMLAAVALFIGACSDSPTTTDPTALGPTTIEEIEANTAYIWYKTGYEAYPPAEDQATFNAAVGEIKNSFDPNAHEVLMVIKPNCGCQTTQIFLPQVMKTLDMAGISHDRLKIYVTDSRLAGIDDVKAEHNVSSAPSFIVLKNDQEVGRIADTDFDDTTPVEEELASLFAKP